MAHHDVKEEAKRKLAYIDSQLATPGREGKEALKTVRKSVLREADLSAQEFPIGFATKPKKKPNPFLEKARAAKPPALQQPRNPFVKRT